MTKTRDMSMKIVIAEDDAITRQWMKRKIGELGMNCLVVGTFEDGSQALEYIRDHEVDVVFTDIRMPVMDGMELLGYLRAGAVPVYKVIFSAYDRFDYARWAMKMGAHEFVPKSELSGASLKQILSEAENWIAQNRRDEQRMPEESGPALSPKQQKRELYLRRMTEETTGGEGALELYAAERKLDPERLLFANLYFGKEVPRETVMEFLSLYLEQDGRSGDCFQNGSQEFSIIYNQKKEERAMSDLERLRSILQAHLGVPVYLGASGVRGTGNGEEYIHGECGEQEDTLADMYRRAAAARENRRFFGIAGCIRYSQLLISASAEEGPRHIAIREKSGSARTEGTEDPSDGGKIPVRINFGQSADRIVTLLEEQRYGSALEELKVFLAAMKEAVRFHPAYVRALSNHILSAYLQEVRRYPLDEEERRNVNGIELWLGWSASNLEELGRALFKVAAFLDDILREKSRGMSYTPAVRQAVQYVRENYGRKLSLDEVADHVHLSRAYLSMLFKKETGQKFSVYLQRVRLEAARILMCGRDLSIQEIADCTGFFDASHLSRAFKARYGCSPMEYRKENSYK